MENLKHGVLFDMDGVIVLTEHLKAEVHSATIKSFGGNVAVHFYKKIMGQSHQKVRAAYIRESGLDIDPEAYTLRYTETLRRRMLTDVRIADGGAELLAKLKNSGYDLALVTSSVRWMMDTVLALTGLGKYFDATICAEDVARTKPAPDPYLLALERLDLSAKSAAIIEDSETGLAAACAAGIPVIAIRHDFNGYHDFSRANVVVDSLADTAGIMKLIEGLF